MLAISVYFLPYFALTVCFIDIWERDWNAAFIMYSLFIYGWWIKSVVLTQSQNQQND